MEKCIIRDMKIHTMVVLPGGGSRSLHYATGILKAFHNTQQLIVDGEFNDEIMFHGTSGGTVPLFLVLIVIWLGLYKSHKNWFELFVERSINKITASHLISVYSLLQIQASIIDYPTPNFVENAIREKLDEIVDAFMPSEFEDKIGFDFKNNKLNNYFRFHYFTDLNGVPVLTAKHDDLTGLSVREQLKQIIATCCTINGKSRIRERQSFDAGTHVSNVVSCLDGYMNNIYLRDVLYGGLYDYENLSFRSMTFTLNYLARDAVASNCTFIEQFKAKCIRKGKSFHYVLPPMKRRPKEKFDVPLYNKLQYKMSLQEDFNDIESFLGFYFFRNSADISLLIRVIGMYETLYVINNINQTRNKLRIDFENINYKFVSQIGYKDNKLITGSRIELTNNIFNFFDDYMIETIIKLIEHQTTKNGNLFIKKCFIKYNGDAYKSSQILKTYLLSMRDRPLNERSDVTKRRLFPANYPIDMFKNPRKYLNIEERRVSDNCLEIYKPKIDLF